MQKLKVFEPKVQSTNEAFQEQGLWVSEECALGGI